MKGGLKTIVGIIIIVIVLGLMYVVISCTTPGSQNSPVCSPMEPLLSLLKSLGL